MFSGNCQLNSGRKLIVEREQTASSCNARQFCDYLKAILNRTPKFFLDLVGGTRGVQAKLGLDKLAQVLVGRSRASTNCVALFSESLDFVAKDLKFTDWFGHCRSNLASRIRRSRYQVVK